MKRIAAKVEEYEKDGETKGKYIELGVIGQSEHGEYVLLDPSVNLAGVLMKQRILNPQKASKSVIASVFTNDREAKPQSSGASGVSRNTDDFDDFDDDLPPF